MRKKKNIFSGLFRSVSESFILKQALFTLFIIILTLSFLGIISIQVFTHFFNQEIADFNTQVLDYSRNSIDNTVFRRIESTLLNAIGTNQSREDLFFFLDHSLEGNHSKILSAQEQLTNIQTDLHDVVSSVHFYSQAENIILSTRQGLNYLSQKGAANRKEFYWLPWFQKESQPKGWYLNEDNSQITFVKSIPFSSPGNKSQGALAVTLDYNALRSKINTLQHSSFSGIYLINSEGERITAPYSTTFSVEFPSTENFVQSIQYTGKQQTFRLEGKDYVSIAIPSQYPDWYYVFLSETQHYYQRALHVRTTVILVCLAIIVLSIVVTQWLNRKLSSPFTKVLSTAQSILGKQPTNAPRPTGDINTLDYTLSILNTQVTDLSSTLNQNRALIVYTFYSNLLEGKITTPHEVEENREFIGYHPNTSCYRTVLVQPHPTIARNISVGRRELFQLGVMELVHNLDSNILAIRETHNIVLLATTKQSVKALLDITQELDSFIESKWNVSCSYGVSESTNDILQLPLCLQQSKAAVSRRSLYEEQFYYYQTHMSQDDVDYALADRWLHDLAKSVANGPSAIEHFCLQLGQKIFSTDSPAHLEYIIEILPRHIHTLSQNLCINLEEIEFERFQSVITNLFFLDDVLLLLEHYLKQIATHLEERSPQSYESYSLRAKEYVLEHLDDASLSLEQVAASLYISGAHLSRVFKESAGENFSTFLQRTRMEAAHEKLTTTNQSIQSIATQVGFSNYNYFSRRFKSFYGSTPTQYRQALADGQSAQ